MEAVAQPREESKRVGANTCRSQIEEAINLLKARASDERVKMCIPKAGGQVLLAADRISCKYRPRHCVGP